MTGSATMGVQYKHVDGWHVFSSLDLPGLYVASQDAETAFNDVAPAIQKLLKLNEGIECQVVPQPSLEEFLRDVRSSSVEREPESVPVYTYQRYAVACG